MSNNKFDALGSDDSEGEVDTNNQALVELESGAFTPLPVPEVGLPVLCICSWF
jgi:hypothetical protein